MMRVLFENIKLFFIRPKQLFFKLKEVPNVQLALIVLLIIVLFFQIPVTRPILSKYTDVGSVIFAYLSSFVGIFVMSVLGLLVSSLYTLLFCRVFGSRTAFNAILSSFIYCRLPNLLSSLIYTFIPVNFLSIFPLKQPHLFLTLLLQNFEPFTLWVSIMEVVAITIVAGISYLKSFIIIFSYLVIGLLLPYLFGFKLP
jgi:hypothetical protein